MSPSVVEKISHEVIKVLYKRFKKFPEDASSNRNAPFHMAFLNAFSDKLSEHVTDIPFFISLSSWLHGLNGTLGQIFFEKVGHILSNGEKREYTTKKRGNLKVDRFQKDGINSIITRLSNSVNLPDLDNEDLQLIIEELTEEVDAIDFSADIFIEDDDLIIAIELKSVRPNSGEMRGEKQKILEGKAALKRMFPNKKVQFFIGFPFDPTNPPDEPTGHNKNRFLASIINMNKYFHSNEVLLGRELWDFLSGETNTMENILAIINSVADVNFLANYQFINENRSAEPIDDYIRKLEAWNLFSELELINNDARIKESIGSNKSLKRVYNQPVFKEGQDYKIEYNIDRYNTLKQLI